jgi:uncharacterized metal-binding protein
MGEADSHEGSGGPKLIFACSGAADVGAISDRVARKLARDGAGQMFCLAGVGGRVPGILDKTRSAERILAIDGCSLDCAKMTLELAGFEDFIHTRVTDLGMEKGQAPATEQNVGIVVDSVEALLG